MNQHGGETETDFEAVLDGLQQSLGHRFRDPALLVPALSTLKQPVTPENAAARQRLEFIGDAAWNYALAVAAYSAYPRAAPGELTRVRAACSSRTGLARLAKRLGVPTPRLAPLGPSPRVRAELLEAVFGAIVEDGGFETIRALAVVAIGQTREGSPHSIVDAKSALQMAALARQGRLPQYRLLEKRGPAHHPTFRASVTVHGPDGEIVMVADGSSRRAAEQEAARLALRTLGEPDAPPHNIS